MLTSCWNGCDKPIRIDQTPIQDKRPVILIAIVIATSEMTKSRVYSVGTERTQRQRKR